MGSSITHSCAKTGVHPKKINNTRQAILIIVLYVCLVILSKFNGITRIDVQKIDFSAIIE
jgi:hypothetical protein